MATEFWRDLKPITKVFKADALPEVFLTDAATGDERFYVPFTDTHPQQVFAYTISGPR